MMTEKDILTALVEGNVVLSTHALQRMEERHFVLIDIRFVGKNAHNIEFQSHGTWKIDGHSSDGRDLTVIVAIEDGTIIVTLF